jgi:hypothetical protein
VEFAVSFHYSRKLLLESWSAWVRYIIIRKEKWIERSESIRLDSIVGSNVSSAIEIVELKETQLRRAIEKWIIGLKSTKKLLWNIRLGIKFNHLVRKKVALLLWQSNRSFLRNLTLSNQSNVTICRLLRVLFAKLIYRTRKRISTSNRIIQWKSTILSTTLTTWRLYAQYKLEVKKRELTITIGSLQRCRCHRFFGLYIICNVVSSKFSDFTFNSGDAEAF